MTGCAVLAALPCSVLSDRVVRARQRCVALFDAEVAAALGPTECSLNVGVVYTIQDIAAQVSAVRGFACPESVGAQSAALAVCPAGGAAASRGQGAVQCTGACVHRVFARLKPVVTGLNDDIYQNLEVFSRDFS